jgi:hypothetical protein
VILDSRRTWWRIASQVEDQMLRPTIPTKAGNKRQPREKPVVKATGQGQVWPWDITDLCSPWAGKSFKAYSVLDITPATWLPGGSRNAKLITSPWRCSKPLSPSTAPHSSSTPIQGRQRSSHRLKQ